MDCLPKINIKPKGNCCILLKDFESQMLALSDCSPLCLIINKLQQLYFGNTITIVKLKQNIDKLLTRHKGYKKLLELERHLLRKIR